jgi:hypothetical protein
MNFPGSQSTNPVAKKGRGKARIAIFFAVAAVALLVSSLLGYQIVTFYKNKGLSERLEKLRVQKIPVTSAELAERYSNSLKNANGASSYMAAFRALVMPEVKGIWEVLPEMECETVLPGKSLKEIRKYVDANKEAIDLLHEAAQIDQCVFKLNLPADLWGTPSYQCMKLDDAAEVMRLAAIHEATRGNKPELLRMLGTQLKIPNSLRAEPSMYAQIYRWNALKKALSAIEYCTSISDFSDREIVHLMNLLSQSALAGGAQLALITQRVAGLEAIAAMADSELASAFGFEPPPFFPRYLLLKYQELHLDMMQKYFSALNLPGHLRIAKLRELEIETESLPELLAMASHPGAGACRGELVFQARKRITLLMLSIKRYRLVHRTPPKNLVELIPDFIEKLPSDVFSGKALVYKTTYDLYQIYSVGENSTDDGGLMAQPRLDDLGSYCRLNAHE